MSKAGKILFYILSWTPLAWSILILTAARFCFINQTTFPIFYPMKIYFYWTALFYLVYGGFFIWLALIILLTWKKIITKRQCIINIILTVVGILSAYLSLHFDIFGVMGTYID